MFSIWIWRESVGVSLSTYLTFSCQWRDKPLAIFPLLPRLHQAETLHLYWVKFEDKNAFLTLPHNAYEWLHIWTLNVWDVTNFSSSKLGFNQLHNITNPMIIIEESNYFFLYDHNGVWFYREFGPQCTFKTLSRQKHIRSCHSIDFQFEPSNHCCCTPIGYFFFLCNQERLVNLSYSFHINLQVLHKGQTSRLYGRSTIFVIYIQCMEILLNICYLEDPNVRWVFFYWWQ